MLAEQPGTRDLIAFVARYMTCSACHHAYGADDVAVDRYSAGFWILSATCPACGQSRTFTAFDRPPYTQMPDMGMTNLQPLNDADVGEWAAFLAHLDGDLIELLGTVD